MISVSTSVHVRVGNLAVLAGVVIVGMLLVSARRMVSMKSPHANWAAAGVYQPHQVTRNKVTP